MFWAAIGVGALVVIVALLAAGGAMVPRRHVVATAIRLPDRDGRAVWSMLTMRPITSEVVEMTPARRLGEDARPARVR